jgi:hypothetical protein
MSKRMTWRNGVPLFLAGIAIAIVMAQAYSACALELPGRKAGLWEISTTGIGNQGVTLQQCVDAATDRALQTRGGALPQRDCSKEDMQKSGNTITVDTVCTVAGKTRTSHVVVTGSFDSGYTMTVTGQTEGQPARPPVTISAKWLGPCAADQKPGDTIMPNGMKMNIQNMPGVPKGAVPPGAAGAPPGH